MNLVGAIAISCLLLLPQRWWVDPTTIRVQQILDDAKAALVEAGDMRPLTVEPTSTPGLSAQLFQGYTTYYPDSIVITVPIRTAPEYDDALVAHELTHVILNSRKFVGGAQRSLKSASLLPNNRTILENDAIRLNSCFPDELIDRETTKRGFNPSLINDMTEGLRNLADGPPNADEGYPDIAKRLQAMLNFCVLIRMSNADRITFKSLVAAKMGPSVSKYTQILVAEFRGKRCAITDPSGCYRLTRQLRHAAGLDEVIDLCTPNAIYQPWNCDK